METEGRVFMVAGPAVRLFRRTPSGITMNRRINARPEREAQRVSHSGMSILVILISCCD